MIEVTIIIPNYNGVKFLKDCLDSLRSQAPGTPSFQVIVVDNGSQDGSLEFLSARYPEVAVISLKENTGFCHAVNVGIRASAAPYCILLNNDTKAAPGFVKALYNAIVSAPRAFAVSAQMLMWDNPDCIDDAGDRYCVLGWAYSRGKGKPVSCCSRSAEVFSACGGAAIYRKSILDEIGLFDELHFAYLEDLDIGYRARIYGYRCYYEPSAQVIHYGSASTGSRYNEQKTVLASANNVYVIAKNMPLLQWIWNFPFLSMGFFIKFLFFCKKGMGVLYVKGLWKGLKKSASQAGRAKKIPFKWKYLGNYLSIQWQLYINTLRFLKKS